jgi:hypothetical protein
MMHAGEMIEGYQAQAQAPLEFIRGGRHHTVDGLHVTGAWSDPWWVYDPQRGWAVAKTWRSKEQDTVEWAAGEMRGRRVTVPAAEETVIVEVAA